MDSNIDLSYYSKHDFENLVKITREKRMLVKKGKIFKRKLIRYFILKNEYLIYFLRKNSNKCRGSINLLRSIAMPMKSPLSKYEFCIKVLTSDLQSEFYIFPLSNIESDLYVLYFKLASNGEISQALEKFNFFSIDQDIQLLSQVTVLRVNKSHSNSLLNNSHIQEVPELYLKKNKEYSFDLQNENDSQSEEINIEIIPSIENPSIKEIPLTKENIRQQGIKCL